MEHGCPRQTGGWVSAGGRGGVCDYRLDQATARTRLNADVREQLLAHQMASASSCDSSTAFRGIRLPQSNQRNPFPRLQTRGDGLSGLGSSR